jgi:dihydroflavonol-4-reductase
MNHQKNIFVTGASGLVGSHLVQRLVEQGKAVKALYRNSIPEYQGSIEVEWIPGDILDIGVLEDALANVQQVYHCAAIVSFDAKEKKLLHKTNIEGTANVVNACLNTAVEKLLFVSSVSALGRIRRDEMITEKMNWSEETSNSVYGKTKFFSEMEVWRGVGEGLPSVIVNPTIILGASNWHKGSSAIFKNAYNEFPWYAEGTTGFVDIDDVVRSMICLMESDINAERFIISAANKTYHELFDLIANEFGKRPPHRRVTPLLAEIVWRIEAIKASVTGKKPLVTKETAQTAQARVSFDNSKLFSYLPHFQYTPLEVSIKRICGEFKSIYNLI